MKKNYYTRLTGKVLLATIVGIITMYTIHLAIDRAFQEITINFENLATPNQRLIAVNNLFRDITQLNNSQQAEAASGRRNPSSAFIQESRALLPKIDTLRAMFAGDTIQINRINEIEKRLMLREEIFTGYMELLYAHKLNPDIRQLIENLSEDLENRSRDNLKVVTLYETITTTTVTSDTLPGEVTGFFQRLFGRSSPPGIKGIVETETRVDKDMVVIVDTIELHRNNNLIPILEYSLDSLHTSQLQQLAGIQKQELELINTNSSLINEINNIINSLEREEFARLNIETQSVFDIARRTIRNLNYLAVIFISVSIVLVLFIIIDISKSNKYRKQLEQAHKEARHESDAKQRFLSNMSHEIRTPLQSIYGYTEHARIHPDQKANIEAIYLSARHLLKVVNEVLDYSKVTSGRISFEKRVFYPDRELKSVVTSMEPLAKQKGINLRYESHLEETSALIGDPFRLRQILYNLSGNAIKFTARGEVAVIVGITFPGHQAELIISVRDTGIGIARERIPGLFDEFTQSGATTSEKNEDAGTGLGLSIVHRLIKLQNGTIEVESTPNEGSCFTVTIPYEIAGLKPERQKKPKNSSKDIDTTLYKPKTAVVVDDDPFILNLSAVILEKQQIPHKTFHAGQDLLDALDEITDAVIFLDMRMPGMSGLELYRKIREHRNNDTLKIYALTAQVLPEERKEITDNGFDGIIIKPFKESDILKALGKTPGEGSRNSYLFNLEPLLRMTDNDNNKTKLFLGTIIKESMDDLKALKRSYDRNRHDELILLVHRMAGRVGQTGDREYAGYLRELERALQNESDSYKLKQRVHESLKRGDLFIRELKNWLLVLK